MTPKGIEAPEYTAGDVEERNTASKPFEKTMAYKNKWQWIKQFNTLMAAGAVEVCTYFTVDESLEPR